MKTDKAIKPTGKRLDELIPKVMKKIDKMHSVRADRIVLAWPEVIGERFAAQTQAVSYEEGILTVKVKNSTLLSVLSTHEKSRLLNKFREKFPQVSFRNIVFRIG